MCFESRDVARNICQALVGGFSVVASVPPLLPPPGAGVDNSTSGGGVILVSARLDAAALFHDMAAGRGLHSSTFQLNMSRFCHSNSMNHPAYPTKGAHNEPKFERA
jgi:hypothetical protein